jgi:hypothetical protein
MREIVADDILASMVFTEPLLFVKARTLIAELVDFIEVLDNISS